MPAADPYQALRGGNFRLYTTGWFLTIVGTQIQSVALQWEIYERTEEPIYLGLVGLVQLVPVLLMILPAGHLADVHDRRKLAMLSLAGATLTSVALAVTSVLKGPTWLLFVLLAVDSTALSIGRPARSALLPLIVPTGSLANAVTWNSSAFQIALMAGPALGGLVVALYVPAAYAVSALCTAAFIVMLGRIRVAAPVRTAASVTLGRLLSGFRFVFDNKLILGTISLDMFAVLLGGAVYLLPIYASDILHVGATGFGWLRAAPAIGACAMAVILAHLPPMQQSGRTLLWAVAGFGAATIVFGLSVVFWLSFAMLVLVGALDNISVVIRHTLVQVRTPDDMRGRVSAVNSVFIGASNELGGFESGLVAQLFTPVISVVSGGIGTIVVVIATAFNSPTLRRFGALEEPRD